MAQADITRASANEEKKELPCLSFCKELVSIAPSLIDREGDGLANYCWKRKAIIEEIFSPQQVALMEDREACCIYFGKNIYNCE